MAAPPTRTQTGGCRPPGSPEAQGGAPAAHAVTCRVDSEFEFTSSAWTPRASCP